MLRKASQASLAASISGAIVSPSVAVSTTLVIVTYTTIDPHNLYVGAHVTITGLTSSDSNDPNVTRQSVYRLDGPNTFSVMLPTTTAYSAAPTITLTGGSGVYGTMRSVNPALSAYKVQYSEPILADRPTFYNYIYPTLKATPTGTGVRLNWTAIGVAFPSTITYRLERVTGTNSSVILSSDAQGTYFDSGIATVGSAQTFNYRVTADNTKAINLTTDSAVSLYIADIDTVTVAPLIGAENSVTVSWAAPVTNALISSYELQRLDVTTTSPAPSWTSLTPTPGQTSFTDSTAVDGINYTYRVRAVADYSADGVVYSTYKTSSSTAAYYMNIPASITATAAAGVANRINVSWDSVSANPATVTYELQEAVSAAGVTYGAWTTVQSTTATSFAQTTAVSGYYYKYRVRAVNAQLTSGYVEAAAAVQAYYLADPVFAPTVAKAASTNSSIVVSGTNNAIPTISGYTIRRSADNGVNWTNIGATNYSITLPYTDSTTATNTAYVYAVKAKNDELTTANWSANSVSIISNSPPLAPTNLSAASGTTGSNINLSWTAASVPSTSPATVTYTLERSLTGTSSWSVVSSAISGTTYNDTGRSLNTAYYYRVLASNSVGSSGYSNTANATITLIPGTATISVPTNTTFNTNVTITATTNPGRTATLWRSTDNTTFTTTGLTRTADGSGNISGANAFTYAITTNTTTVQYFRIVVAQDSLYTQTTSASDNTTTVNNTLNIAYYTASQPNTGTNNTLTFSVTDVNGNAVSGASINFQYQRYGTNYTNFDSVTSDANGRGTITYGIQSESINWAGAASKSNYTSAALTSLHNWYIQEGTGYVTQTDYRSHAEQNGWNGRIGGDEGYMYSGWWSTNQGRQAGSAYWSSMGTGHSWARINSAISIDGVYINLTRRGGTGGTGMNISYGVHNSASAVTDFDNLGKATNLLWGATNVPAYSASNNREYGVNISAIKDYFKSSVWSSGAKGLTFGHQTESTTQDNYAVINNNVEMFIYYVADPNA